MALIRIKTKAKDYFTSDPNHPRLSRRDFISRGMATGAMTVLLPEILMSAAAKSAFAEATACAAPVAVKGGLFQYHGNGGPTMSNRILSDAEANVVESSKNAANQYGIIQGDILKIGPNFNIAQSSPFGKVLLAGPGGAYTPEKWMQVLAKCSAGGHAGAFFADDGGGANAGHVGAVSAFKATPMNKDLRFGSIPALAPWAEGSPAAGVSKNATPANLATAFSLSPSVATTGVKPGTFVNAASAAGSLAGIFDSIFGLSGRKGGSNLTAAATCGFSGDQVMADPTFAAKLFDPTKISVLNDNILAGNNLSQQEQALLSAFYQSAMGQAAGVHYQGGSDYHGQNVQTNIGPTDIEAARALVMFLAACDQAGARGAYIHTSNGNCNCNGVSTNVAITTNGVSNTYAVGNGAGDAGGFYNKGIILVFDPAGSPPELKTTGSFSANDGRVTADPNAGTVPNAVAGLYLTALTFLGSDTGKLVTKMGSRGISSSTASKVILL